MIRKSVLGILGAASLAALGSLSTIGTASAAEVTLRLHQFLPPQANVPKHILEPWMNTIEIKSDGRIEIEHFPAMQLGGSPPELFDQAADGIADVVWTVVGYTPGRFPSTEVFELPFMVEDARAASYAYWTMYERHMQDEFADVKILGAWVHGPGMFHTKKPVTKPSDLRGMKIRGGSRLVNKLLETTGAEPIGMPVPAVPEALSKGVIDGTTIPWEVTTALKIPELVKNHTGFEGNALYTLTFILAMNNDTYDSLPDDLKSVIDENSGLAFSVFAGGVMQEYDAPAREIAEKAGNSIVTISEEDAEEWKEVVQPIYADWIADMDKKGIDGQAMINEAHELMSFYSDNQ